MKQQELARVKSHLAGLNAPISIADKGSTSRRQVLKDALIQVCRAACSEEQWDALMQQAKQPQAEQEGAHG
jgi:hypothetical protein